MSKPPLVRPVVARRRLTAGGAVTPAELAIAALVSRLPPAAPGDLAVERVWRRLQSPAQKRVPRPLWLGIPAVSLLVVAVAVLLLRGSPAAELTLVSGGVYSSRPGETWRANRGGERVVEADRVRTDSAGHALFRAHGVVAMLIGSESDVAFERLGRGTFLRLSRGTLTARVSKRKPGESFVVQTDRYTVTVVGTLFVVEQGPDDHTAVSVQEGIVEVSDGHQTYRVMAGTRWTSDAVEARSPDRTSDRVKGLLEKELGNRSAAELAPDFAVVVAKSAEPSGVTSSAVDRDDNRGPRSASPAEPEPSAPPSVASAPKPLLSIASSRASDRTTAYSTTLGPVGAAPPDAGARTTIQDDSYAKGLALAAKGELDAAARELARAADLDPVHGDLPLFSLGRLAQRRLHDPKRALSAFRRYREQYPQGTLLPEVDFAILELEVEGHEAASALADSARFLAVHPDSERVDEVHFLRATLLRDADRCREALEDYAKVREPGRADEALYSTAYCQRRLGDRPRAVGALQEYLVRFPRGAHRADAERALESVNATSKPF
jgi:tetratricopeptide (TPR) repeat protein